MTSRYGAAAVRAELDKPHEGTVRCADCQWQVVAVESVAWARLHAHRATTHDREEK